MGFVRSKLTAEAGSGAQTVGPGVWLLGGHRVTRRETPSLAVAREVPLST